MVDLLKENEEVLVSLQQRDMRLLKSVGDWENFTIGFVILEVRWPGKPGMAREERCSAGRLSLLTKVLLVLFLTSA